MYKCTDTDTDTTHYIPNTYIKNLHFISCFYSNTYKRKYLIK